MRTTSAEYSTNTMFRESQCSTLTATNTNGSNILHCFFSFYLPSARILDFLPIYQSIATLQITLADTLPQAICKSFKQT